MTPIDVLAKRRNTTRGALYKTLHDARRKLRTRLADDGLALTPGAPEQPPPHKEGKTMLDFSH